ncbi:MAG: peptidase [bacterium]|nr:peptidase [bacterium]
MERDPGTADRVPVVDLHCDLLYYLAEHPHASPMDEDLIGCAIPHLQAGNVRLQVMAIYTGSADAGADDADRQLARYLVLLRSCDQFLKRFDDPAALLGEAETHRIQVLPAMENAAALAGPDDDRSVCRTRLATVARAAGPVAYVGLTHHGENRFGGGNMTRIGLKSDGEYLLEELARAGITVDLSHASDQLAEDIIEYIHQRGLDLPLMASHSNFRAVQGVARNLPDHLAREIIERGGLIGLNLLRSMLGDDGPRGLHEQVAHGMRLGGEDALCFGADFFCELQHPHATDESFFPEACGDAGAYPRLLAGIARDFGHEVARGIGSVNAARFLGPLAAG